MRIEREGNREGRGERGEEREGESERLRRLLMVVSTKSPRKKYSTGRIKFTIELKSLDPKQFLTAIMCSGLQNQDLAI